MKPQYTIAFTTALLITVHAMGQQPQSTQKPQESINQDVRVVRDYTPSISDATKLNQMPVLDDTSSYRPVFKYSILSRPIESDGKIEPITPARLSAERPPMVTNTRIKAGMGINNSLMGELDYNMPSSSDYLLGLSLRQFSSWGNVKLEDDKKVDAPLHNTFAGVELKRFFPTLTLTSHMQFERHSYDYYGFQAFDTANVYEIPGKANPVKGTELSVDPFQRTSQFTIGAGLANRDSNDDNVQWQSSIDYSSFGNKTGVKQNGLNLSGNLRLPFNNLYFKSGLDINIHNLSAPDTLGMMFDFDNRQITLIKATPRVGYDFGNGYVEAGLFLAGEFGREDDEVRAAPHLYAQLDVAQGIVSLFGGLSAHLNGNDYASMQRENPYISPDVLIKSSYYGMNLLGGIKGNFSSAASFAARVEYSMFNDEHFYINNWHQTTLGDIESVNRFGVVYDDGSLLKLGGELLVTPTNAIQLKLTGNYYGWELDQLEKAWHKPQMDLGLGAIVKATRDLQLEAAITYVGKRDALIMGNTPTAKEFKGFFDANLAARYDLTSNWSFWTELNNIAAADYQQWVGYPSFLFHVMVGASYCF
jgi:hypothetical protein